jgi:branched-chain amino acid aminotransferase
MKTFEIIKAEKSRMDTIDWDNLGFGIYFSDHMFVSDYTNGKWDDGKIVPYGPMSIEPTNCTLHYGQSIFEGMKAFPTKNGGINLFRPYMNARRLNRSGRRVCIPSFDEDTFVDAIKQLVKLDYNFIPKKPGTSLYIRPVAFGISNFLGVHPSKDYRLVIMTSPVGSYYPEGLNPVKILISTKYVRAVPGGTGSAKTAANYAASLLAGKEAKEQGYSQVLWLDGVNRTLIDEVGAMNIMFVINDELITPSLETGTILEGVTRDSVLRIANDQGIKVTERAITIDEIVEANQKGTLQECFGTGTAAVISPVGLLSYNKQDFIINNMKIGPIAQMFYDKITGIQYGELDDEYDWITTVEKD